MAPDKKQIQRHVMTKVGMLLTFGLACFGKRELEVLELGKLGIRVVLSCETFKRNVKTFGLLGTRSCARVWILDFVKVGFSHC